MDEALQIDQNNPKIVTFLCTAGIVHEKPP
jgi:hypothetical protein